MYIPMNIQITEALMCTAAEQRIRINKIMSHTINARLALRPTNLDELTHLCVVALQIYYDGACPEECLEAKARDFAAWQLARAGHDHRQFSGLKAFMLGVLLIFRNAPSGFSAPSWNKLEPDTSKFYAET
jgi:hypothetical protein